MGRRKDNKKKKRSGALGHAAITAQKKATILHDLGRSAEDRPIFSLPSPPLPWGAAILVFLLVLLVPALMREGPGGLLLAAAFALASFVALLIPRKLVLGDDGLLLFWLGSRFIRYRDIAYIETTDGFFFHQPGINIALKNGRAIAFTTSLFKERWAERDALIALLRLFAEDAARKKITEAPQAILRAGRSHAAWARLLRSIGHGAHFDARSPAVVPEDLLRIAENPAAPVVDRAAAFVVLSAAKDLDTERRLRIAAGHTVAPAARAALTGALEAGENEDEIARVLECAEKSAHHD